MAIVSVNGIAYNDHELSKVIRRLIYAGSTGVTLDYNDPAKNIYLDLASDPRRYATRHGAWWYGVGSLCACLDLLGRFENDCDREDITLGDEDWQE